MSIVAVRFLWIRNIEFRLARRPACRVGMCRQHRRFRAPASGSLRTCAHDEILPERILVREKFLHESFVHHDDRFRVRLIVRIETRAHSSTESASRENNRVSIIRCDALGSSPAWWHRLTDNREGHATIIAAKWKWRDRTDSFNAGKRGKFRKQPIEKLGLLLGLRVTLLGKALPKRSAPDRD